MLNINKVYLGDCLEVMKGIDDKSIDMILCDLPYGTTACKWDVVIPFEPMWEQYKRIIKDRGAIVLTGSQPFTSMLIMSNLKWFKYEWIWEKPVGGFLNCNYSPLKRHENIVVFSDDRTIYNPQKTKGKPYACRRTSAGEFLGDEQNKLGGWVTNNDGDRFPTSILKMSNNQKLHPTQKPLSLFEYMIKTYTNEGDLVLDNCAGSGTTGVAARNLKRNYILIEKEPEYVDLINKRLAGEITSKKNDPYQARLF